jgi:hypothetical protein
MFKGTFLLTCGKQKPEIFSIPSLSILVCLEGGRAYPTLVGHRSECVKALLIIIFCLIFHNLRSWHIAIKYAKKVYNEMLEN